MPPSQSPRIPLLTASAEPNEREGPRLESSNGERPAAPHAQNRLRALSQASRDSAQTSSPSHSEEVESDGSALFFSVNNAQQASKDESTLGNSQKSHRDDVEDEDDEDIVAVSAEDTRLQGGYQPVGNRSGTEYRDHVAMNKRKLVRKIAINLLLICIWFFFSTLMNIYNSWLFSNKRKKFSYPLFVTSIHMLVQFGLSSLLMWSCQRHHQIVPRRRNGKRARPSAHDWMMKVMPCALATALDIGLSNLSLKTITLTFYTMCKSSNLAFVLLFAFLFHLEKVRLSLIGIIALITIGVVMMVAAETEFVLEGAVEVLTASAMGGLRWALMQILLSRKSMGMNNPIATMFWLSPLMALFMITGSLSFENWHEMLSSAFFQDFGSTVQSLGLMIAPGFIVFFMNLSEFALIMRTSVVTLSVAGIFKEILTILISSNVFGDELTPINVTGLCVALTGIALFNYLKWRLMVAQTQDQTVDSHGRSGELDSDEEEEPNRCTELGGGAVEPLDKNALSPEEENDRRRQREEEASLAGWGSSGFQRTGNGYEDRRSSDSDE